MHPTIEEPTVQLTQRQLQILQAIAGCQQSRRYSPTIAEVASELGTSRSTAFEHIGGLRRKGLLSACPGRARSLILTSRARELLSSLASDASEEYTQRSTGLPLVGKVAAGSPIEAIENTEPVSLSSCFGPGEDTFALEVEGDSMIDEDIRQGDYVICRRSSVAEDGQLVVAIVDDDNATLKRFYREKTRARLEPANEHYEPIYSDNCRIEAVVIGLLRKL